MTLNLPLLPGHRFSDPLQQNFHKSQVFEKKTNTNLGKIFSYNRKKILRRACGETSYK